LRYGEETALLTFEQALRPQARETVQRLKSQGYRLAILSGDSHKAVAGIAAELGIEDAMSGLRPDDKIAALKALKDQGHLALMVGDGLNDAPALARAHVSLSPVSAVHLTQAQADAVFLGESLAPVADALAIARIARKLMNQNLWLAVIYNAIAVPVAILGWVTPLVAALAMSGSSLLVTLNALRARGGWFGAR
jgi:Cu2+-exporting ATPase